MSRPLLDTGQPALWDTTQQLARLDRCPGCEHHVDTQGHGRDCPQELLRHDPSYPWLAAETHNREDDTHRD